MNVYSNIFLIDNSQYITNLLVLQALSEKNKISCEMKKIPHTAGTKSYARWSEDLVSPFSRSIDFSSISFLPLLYYHYFFRDRQIPQKKQLHRAQVYLATHRKRVLGTNEDTAAVYDLYTMI